MTAKFTIEFFFQRHILFYLRSNSTLVLVILKINEVIFEVTQSYFTTTFSKNWKNQKNEKMSKHSKKGSLRSGNAVKCVEMLAYDSLIAPF